MQGPFDDIFDLNHDRERDAFERFVEFETVTGGFVNDDEDEDDDTDDDDDEDDDFSRQYADFSFSEDDEEDPFDFSEDEEEEEDYDFDDDDDEEEEEFEPHSDEELKQFSEGCRQVLQRMMDKCERECLPYLDKMSDIVTELKVQADTLEGELSDRQSFSNPGKVIYYDGIMIDEAKGALEGMMRSIKSEIEWCRKHMDTYAKQEGNDID